MATRHDVQERTRVDLGVAYGLVGGAGGGALLMALTGDVMWVSIGPALGLLIGLTIASLLASRRSDAEQD